MQEEIWKDVKGYEGLYKVSNLGNIKSLRNYSGILKKYYKCEKIMKQRDNGRGYLQIILCKNNIREHKYVHRLVAEAFISNPFLLPEINHIDENKQNNNVSNLEWCDRSYNNRYGSKIKRYVEKVGKKVEQIDINNNQVVATFPSIKASARQTGMTFSSIQRCCNGKIKTYNGYIWRYADEVED